MIRQNLTPGSPYADVMVHGDGLTSLQYRVQQDGPTYQIESAVSHPRRVQLEREGDFVYFSVAGEDGKLRHAGGSFRIASPGALLRRARALGAQQHGPGDRRLLQRHDGRCRSSRTCPTPATRRRSKARSR